MRRNVPALLLVAAAGVLLVALAASALGWFGGVTVCGADRALGCVTWPPVISGLIWSGFLAGVAALVVWQVRYLDR